MKEVTNFIFEIGYLRNIKRTQLKSNPYSIAEHTFRVVFIAYILAQMERKIDIEKVLLMALFHDVPETRTGDLDLVNKRYISVNEDAAFSDIVSSLSSPNQLKTLFEEYQRQESLASKIVHDADILEELFTEKEQHDHGHAKAQGWMEFSYKRLLTRNGKRLAQKAMSTNSDAWWHALV